MLCDPEFSTVRNARDLAHIPLIILSPTNVDSRDENQPLPPRVETTNSLFGAGLPSVPSKQVKGIEVREFIGMAELPPEQLATYTPHNDHTKSSKSKMKPVTNTLD